MSCSICHNKDSLGAINYLQALRNKRDVTAFLFKKSMTSTFIEKGWMPPNNQLDSAERTALDKCLQKEYYDVNSKTGILMEWLTGQMAH